MCQGTLHSKAPVIPFDILILLSKVLINFYYFKIDYKFTRIYQITQNVLWQKDRPHLEICFFESQENVYWFLIEEKFFQFTEIFFDSKNNVPRKEDKYWLLFSQKKVSLIQKYFCQSKEDSLIWSNFFNLKKFLMIRIKFFWLNWKWNSSFWSYSFLNEKIIWQKRFFYYRQIFFWLYRKPKKVFNNNIKIFMKQSFKFRKIFIKIGE